MKSFTPLAILDFAVVAIAAVLVTDATARARRRVHCEARRPQLARPRHPGARSELS